MRKIWNFAMAAIVIVASAGLFSACDKDELAVAVSLEDKIGYEFAETNLSVMDILSSSEIWNIKSQSNYTEPNGKGEESEAGWDVGGHPPLGWSMPDITFSKDLMTCYCLISHNRSAFYRDYPITQVEDYMYLLGDSGDYLKILDYDENCVLIETTIFTVIGDYEYPYAIVLLGKGEAPSDPNWRDKYVSYEEYINNLP